MYLLHAELAAGCVLAMPHLTAARAEWPQVAIGQAKVVVADNRGPCLVIAPSIGCQRSSLVPARYVLPRVGGIR